jgi:UDP-glucose 4-epimerase
VLDDLSTGTWRPDFDARLLQIDITSRGTAAAVREAHPDLVIHAAAQVSVPASFTDLDRDRAVNVEGTRNVLDGALQAGTGRFVFISSGGAIYGETSLGRETDVPRPQSYYGVHKLAAEHYVRLSGLSYANLRLANVYGPGQQAVGEGAVVATFVDRLRNTEPIVIHGDGSQRRDFVYVADVVSAVMAAIDAPPSGTWNIATQRAVSVLELLSRLERTCGRRAEIKFGPARPSDVSISRLSVARARGELGWRPVLSLTDGLRETIRDQGLLPNARSKTSTNSSAMS